jgi:predicted PurR-regulated permease PerM
MAADESGSTPQVSLEERSEKGGLIPVAARGGALTILASILGIYFLQWAQQLLIPVVLAVLIAFALTPVVNLFSRILWRAVASALAIVLTTAALGVGVWAVTDDAVAVIRDVPEAARRVRTLVRQHRRAGGGTIQQVQRAATEIEKTANAAAPNASSPPSDVQQVEIVNPAFKASDYLWWGGMGLVGFLGQLVMIFFLSYFLLSSGDLYKLKLVRIAGPTLSQRKVTVQILDDISEQIGRFLVTQVATSAVVGALTAVALWWLDLESWLFWGIMAGVLNSIPYFGPVIVSAALAVVAFLQFGTVGRTLAVTGVAFAITSLEGFLITPALMGKAARMNPAAIFVGLLFWGWIWGMWGVILAVPMMMLIKSICDHVEDFAAVGELLGD